MILRSLGVIFRQSMSSMAASTTPVEDAVRAKILKAITPLKLEIYNDSHYHAHHEPMRDKTSKETHFRIYITSDIFKSMMQPARHRMVYNLLREEMTKEGGIHALQLQTRTPEEEERMSAREQGDRSERATKCR